MSSALLPELARRLRDAPEGLAALLLSPSPAATWYALGALGEALADEPMAWHHLALHGPDVARAFRPGVVLFVVGLEALDAEGRAALYAHLNRARDQLPRLGTRLVLFVPTTDEDLYAEHAVDLLALRGPVRRLADAEGPPVVLPPRWEVVRDVAARCAIACVPSDFPSSLLGLLRSIPWGGILFEAGAGPVIERSTDLRLAEGEQAPGSWVGSVDHLTGDEGRRPVDLVSEVRLHPGPGTERDTEPTESAVRSWLVALALAARRPQPVRWVRAHLVEPEAWVLPAGERRITLVVTDSVGGSEPTRAAQDQGQSRPAGLAAWLARARQTTDAAGLRAALRSFAVESDYPRRALLGPLSVAAEVVCVGHDLGVEATLDAAGVPWTYGRERLGDKGVRVLRPWGSFRLAQELRADPWPFPDGRAPLALRRALGRPTAWCGERDGGVRTAALALRAPPQSPQLVIGPVLPFEVEEAGFVRGADLEAIGPWAASLVEPAPEPVAPPLADLPNDPALAQLLARPSVRWEGRIEPLLDVLGRVRCLWVVGAPGCGKSLFAKLLEFGLQVGADPAWSAWAPPSGLPFTRIEFIGSHSLPRASAPDTLWVADDAHEWRPSERQRLRAQLPGLAATGHLLLVLDRHPPDPDTGLAEWMEATDRAAWFHWSCADYPELSAALDAGLLDRHPTWRAAWNASAMRRVLREGGCADSPAVLLELATRCAAEAWREVSPDQLGDVQRELDAAPTVLPELARRRLPGALRRTEREGFAWVRETDALLARALSTPAALRGRLPPGAIADPADVRARTMGVVEAIEAELVEPDVLAGWIAEAARRPAFVAPYLAAALKRFELGLTDLQALLSLDRAPLRDVLAEVHATHTLLGSWAVGPRRAPRPDEGELRNVQLTEFRIDAAPVTSARYQAFVDIGGYLREDLWEPDGWAWRTREGLVGPAFTGPPDVPVTGVSWFEAAAFARWQRGRLPTEAQWEAAAVFGGRGAWSGQLEPVYTRPGLPSDLGGNVLEWCRDGYDPHWPGVAPAWDPVGPPREERSARGAPYWVTDPDDREYWRRWHLPPRTRRADLGFRVVYTRR